MIKMPKRPLTFLQKHIAPSGKVYYSLKKGAGAILEREKYRKNPKRPPRKWFLKMMKRVRKQYPTYSKRRIAKIVAGIWYMRLAKKVKSKILGGE